MVGRDPVDPARSGVPDDHPGSVDDELIGLDPDDPETRAFADHLGRMRRDRPGYTVEGYLDGVSDFADSANRATGGRRLVAVLLVGLLLLVTGYLVADAAGFVLSTWFSSEGSSDSSAGDVPTS